MMKQDRPLAGWLSVVLTAWLLAGCSTVEYRRAEGAVWGTTYHITYRSDKVLDDSIQAVMRQVELSLSMFCDSSVVSRVNRNETADVDSMFAVVFRESQRISRASHGAFDPTVAPLVNLWGFGHKKVEQHQYPSRHSVDSALSLVGIGGCRLVDGRIAKKSRGTEFDFSAVAKGFGCDCVAGMFKRNGCDDYMVEIGGEIAVGGKSPRATAWRVMVDAPVSADTIVHEKLAVIEISDCGVATSGNYRNYRDTSGGRVGHTIDPVTGYPRQTSTLSATVVAPSCMTADALATACMAMSCDSAMSMIEAMPDVSALLVVAEGDGKWRMMKSSKFPTVH